MYGVCNVGPGQSVAGPDREEEREGKEMNIYTATRQIGIDAAHRVPTHGSKCRNLHGHRYCIEATVHCQILNPEGEQKDMAIDFGFLKEVMMHRIDEPCDHGLMLWEQDPIVPTILEMMGDSLPQQKLALLPFIPTAERLAQFWFHLMQNDVRIRSEGVAELFQLRVYETPNCWADYYKAGAK